MSWAPKNSFSLPQTECPDTDGLVPAVTEGRPGAARPVDHGWLGCGGSELLSPGKHRAGAPPAPVQVRRWELWLVLPCSTGPRGPFWGRTSPELCCFLGLASVWGGDALKCPLSLAWPCSGGRRRCPPRACHAPSTALGPSSKKAVSAGPLPPKQETRHLLEQLVSATTVH